MSCRRHASPADGNDNLGESVVKRTMPMYGAWSCGLVLALAVGSVFAQEAGPAPTASSTTQTDVPPAAVATGRLVVYRINAYPTLRRPKVIVDGALMFRPKQKTYAEMELPSGRHNVVVNWPWDTGWPDLDFDIEIAPGETKYLQISGSFTPADSNSYEVGSAAYEVEPEKGAEDIRTCCKRQRLR
jgi:hypothetical protein